MADGPFSQLPLSIHLELTQDNWKRGFVFGTRKGLKSSLTCLWSFLPHYVQCICNPEFQLYIGIKGLWSINYFMYSVAEAPVQQYACSFLVFKVGSNIYVSLDSHTHRKAYINPTVYIVIDKAASGCPLAGSHPETHSSDCFPKTACECPILCKEGGFMTLQLP